MGQVPSYPSTSFAVCLTCEMLSLLTSHATDWPCQDAGPWMPVPPGSPDGCSGASHLTVQAPVPCPGNQTSGTLDALLACYRDWIILTKRPRICWDGPTLSVLCRLESFRTTSSSALLRICSFLDSVIALCRLCFMLEPSMPRSASCMVWYRLDRLSLLAPSVRRNRWLALGILKSKPQLPNLSNSETCVGGRLLHFRATLQSFPTWDRNS